MLWKKTTSVIQNLTLIFDCFVYLNSVELVIKSYLFRVRNKLPYYLAGIT